MLGVHGYTAAYAPYTRTVGTIEPPFGIPPIRLLYMFLGGSEAHSRREVN